jgi:hypothetical protein
MLIEDGVWEDIGESCTNLIEKSKGKASNGRPGSSCVYNIKLIFSK